MPTPIRQPATVIRTGVLRAKCSSRCRANHQDRPQCRNQRCQPVLEGADRQFEPKHGHGMHRPEFTAQNDSRKGNQRFAPGRRHPVRAMRKPQPAEPANSATANEATTRHWLWLQSSKAIVRHSDEPNLSLFLNLLMRVRTRRRGGLDQTAIRRTGIGFNGIMPPKNPDNPVISVP